MAHRAIALGATFLIAGACGVTDPPADPQAPTLLVTNATCDSGPCVKFDVRGLEGVYVVPGQPPSGFIYVGSVDSATTCMRFPAKMNFYDNAVDSQGRIVRTDTITWTVKDEIQLTAARPNPYDLPYGSTPTSFVPAHSPGWRVTFPSGDFGPAAPCQP